MDSTITTPGTLAALRKLTVEPGHLSPPLMPRCRAYAVFVAHQTQSIALTCDAGDGHVTVNSVPVANGKPTEPIQVEIGRTLIHVVVTAPDGLTTRTYI